VLFLAHQVNDQYRYPTTKADPKHAHWVPTSRGCWRYTVLALARRVAPSRERWLAAPLEMAIPPARLPTTVSKQPITVSR
jgi:hypothetical protein